MRLGERSMAELFISYSHSDRKSVSDIAIGLEKTGHQVWWDRRLRAYQDFGKEIEAAIEKANCAIVAWSATARNSLLGPCRSNCGLGVWQTRATVFRRSKAAASIYDGSPTRFL
jgi:TIR domain